MTIDLLASGLCRVAIAVLELTELAVGAFPSLDALLVAVLVAAIMAELVVPGPTELGAGGVVVVPVALYAHPVCQSRRRSSVVQRVPLRTRVDDARVRRLLDYVVRRYKFGVKKNIHYIKKIVHK